MEPKPEAIDDKYGALKTSDTKCQVTCFEFYMMAFICIWKNTN